MGGATLGESPTYRDHMLADSRGRTFDVRRSNPAAAAAYPVAPRLTLIPDPRPVYWRRGPVLNQQREGACVGHGVTAELTATPDRVDLTSPAIAAAWKANGGAGTPPTKAQDFAFWDYHEAQKDDPWTGEDYEGTSVDAGLRVARRCGTIGSWRWAKTRTEFRAALQALGPVLLAIPWLDGMYEAPGGLLRIEGSEVGWHCILANGYHPSLSIARSPKGEKARLLNSWGTSWGDYGSAWVDFGRLWDLIEANGGEMVVPLGRKV